MYINSSRRFQIIKRWFRLLRDLKKARENIAPEFEGTWDSDKSQQGGKEVGSIICANAEK